MNKIKKSIRDTLRLMNKPNLDADKKQDLQKRLRATLFDMEKQTELLIIKRYSDRYTKIRFFELRKAERKIQKLIKEGGSEHEIQTAYQDIIYILYYPRVFKYISLYKVSEEENNDSKTIKQLKKRDKMYDIMVQIAKELNLKNFIKLPVKSLSVDASLLDKVVARIFDMHPEFLEEHYMHLVSRNKNIYEQCGIKDLKKLAEERLELLQNPKLSEKIVQDDDESIIDQNDNVDEEEFHDDFFGKFTQADSVSKKALKNMGLSNINA